MLELNEFIGVLVIAVGVMLGSFLPLINALLKLNTTLNRLGHVIDTQQMQLGGVLSDIKILHKDLEELKQDYVKHMYTKHKGTE